MSGGRRARSLIDGGIGAFISSKINDAIAVAGSTSLVDVISHELKTVHAKKICFPKP